jgi:hypothetical protein
MNEQERLDLERLKERHSQLERELALLGQELKVLETRVGLVSPREGTRPTGSIATEADRAATSPPVAVKMPEGSRQEIARSSVPAESPRQDPVPPPIPPPLPPVIRPAPQPVAIPAHLAPRHVTPPPGPAQPTVLHARLQVEPGKEKFLKCACEFCGGHIEFPASALGNSILCPHCGRSTRLSTVVDVPPVPPRIVERSGPAGGHFTKANEGNEDSKLELSWEMRLGRHWAPRIGVVMVLTAFVFFGNYAYENYVGKLGPAGKVSLLYLASGLLFGAGAWWQRKAAKASLRNYGQVLFAGGLAAVYFTTYAAHHIEPLRVIGSSLVDGALLLGWAGFMVWIADRKKSEVLALFAVGLAYYTSVITRAGSFTLYSNLVLTLAAVFFLVRNRWAALSFASLAATYAAYGFWRFFSDDGWHWATPGEGLWFGTYFLVSYWIVFTTAVFLSKHEKFAGPNRAGFLTLNNGALFLLTMLQVHEGGFWRFALIYGAVLLALAELARHVLAAETSAKNAYLTQGLLLVTIGLISRFTGLKLALILGAESVVLLTLGFQRKSLVLQIGAYLSGALAVAWGIGGLERNDLHGLCLNGALGAMMVFNAWWSHRRSAGEKELLVRPVPTYFTLLALVSWLAMTWYNTSAGNFPLALAIEALVLTASIYVLRMGEIVLLGQGYLLLGQFAWLFHFAESAAAPPWWNPALMIVVTTGLSHWWQRQKVVSVGGPTQGFWQGVYALAIVGVVFFWLQPLVGAPVWLVLASLLAIGITAYGVFTRAWFLAACGQIFLLVSAGQFALQLSEKTPDWYFPLSPLLAFCFLSFSTVKWFQRRPDADERVRGPLLQLALIYRWVALVMSLWWVWKYIPAREQIWVLALAGLLVFLWAGWRRNGEGLLFAAAFTMMGLGLFWLPLREVSTVYWPNLIALVVLLGQQQIVRRLPERYQIAPRAQGAMIILGGLSLWLLLYRWLCQNASGFYITASWSALALVLFGCGMALRERVYRWLGLAVLASALGRVVIFDVWKLETLYRILSFMALGIVLLVLGFIYNKYQEKIKEWL